MVLYRAAYRNPRGMVPGRWTLDVVPGGGYSCYSYSYWNGVEILLLLCLGLAIITATGTRRSEAASPTCFAAERLHGTEPRAPLERWTPRLREREHHARHDHAHAIGAVPRLAVRHFKATRHVQCCRSY